MTKLIIRSIKHKRRNILRLIMNHGGFLKAPKEFIEEYERLLNEKPINGRKQF